MRFIPEGPDVPDALVLEQERGEVVFVCGAGVSITAGLPSFASLVKGVYLRLGEDWQPHYAEREVMAPNGRMAGQFDRALRCLERRLAAHDVREVSGMRRRIRKAVDEQLRPAADADLSNHLALLELSRGSDNASRLLTTNFDCLFEHSWRLAGRPDLASHAGPAMPRQGTAAFEGVLHLHGRIADAGLTETDLVLTSAEFGEAYLRSGWAARYVYDLARARSLVLVGYQADDPPMRYLLEVLEDDRARYPDLRQVYAFAPASLETEVAERAMWAAKGIEPITYLRSGPSDHAALYSSLRIWRDYALAPGRWRKARLRELLAGPPEERLAVEEIVTLLSKEDAPTALFELAPEASWWPILATHPDLRGRADGLRAWITARADDPAMLQACVADRPEGTTTYDGALLSAQQKPSSVPVEVAHGWRLLALSATVPVLDSNLAWYSAIERIRASEIDHSVREVAVDLVRPRLRVERVLDWPGAKAPMGLEMLFRVSFETKGHPTSTDVLQAWPRDTNEEAALFRIADRALADALDQALDAGYQAGFDRAGNEVGSLSGGRPLFETGFAPLTRLVAALWDRIAHGNRGLARSLALAWEDDVHPLRRRLHLHAVARPGVFGGTEAWAALSGVNDAEFWSGNGERELIKALAERWSDIPSDGQEALQARILGGPPRQLLWASTEEDWWITVRDLLIFQRLEPIRRAGVILSDHASQVLTDLTKTYPDGYLNLPEDEERLHRSGLGRHQADAGQLDGVPDSRGGRLGRDSVSASISGAFAG